MFTSRDREDLKLAVDLMRWADEIVSDIVNRRPMDLNAQMIYFLNEAHKDAELGAKEIDRATRYVAWKIDEDGERAS